MTPKQEKYRKAAFFVFALFSSGLFLTGCEKGKSQVSSSDSDPLQAAKRKIEVVQVSKGTLESVVEVPVSIEGYQMTSLVSKLEAYVGEVKVDIGQEVKKGDILATLEAPEMLAEKERRLKMMTMNEKALESAEADMATSSAEVDQAKAKLSEQKAMLKLRESEISRVRALVNKRVIVKERLNEAQYELDSVNATVSKINADVAATEAAVRGKAAKVESARAEIGVAQAELEKVLAEAGYLEIRAPFDGLITERLVHPGAFVLPAGTGGSPLFTIEDVDNMKAVMYLPISEAASIDGTEEVVIHSLQGHPRGFTIPSGAESEKLTVTRFANSLDRGSRMMRVEVDLKNPKAAATGARILKPGGYGKATLSLQKFTDIAIVPESAVVQGESGPYVVIVNANNTSEFVPVDVAITVAEKSGVVPKSGSLAALFVIVSDAAEFKAGEDLSGDTISKINH